MRFNCLLSVQCVLSLGVSALSWPEIATQSTPVPNRSRLKPVNIRDFEYAIGISRRSAEDFSDLHLKSQSQLIYGRPGSQCLLSIPTSKDVLMVRSEESIRACQHDAVRPQWPPDRHDGALRAFDECGRLQ